MLARSLARGREFCSAKHQMQTREKQETAQHAQMTRSGALCDRSRQHSCTIARLAAWQKQSLAQKVFDVLRYYLSSVAGLTSHASQSL